MTDKIEITRDLLVRLNNLHVTGNDIDIEMAEVRALLDDPVVERQETVAPWFYFVECDDPDYSVLFNHENEALTQANDHGGEVVKLWNVPPTWRPSEHPAQVAAAQKYDDTLLPFVALMRRELHANTELRAEIDRLKKMRKLDASLNLECEFIGERDAALSRIAELETQLAKANDWSHIAPVAASPSRFTERFCTISIPGWSCSRDPGHTGPCAETPDPDKPA